MVSYSPVLRSGGAFRPFLVTSFQQPGFSAHIVETLTGTGFYEVMELQRQVGKGSGLLIFIKKISFDINKLLALRRT